MPTDDPAGEDRDAGTDEPKVGWRMAVSQWWAGTEARERRTLLGLAAFGVAVALAVFVGVLDVSYLLFLLGPAAMFSLLTLGLNVQWGYTGLVNFSVIAFWGIGAYSAAMTTAGPRSPTGLALHPIVGLLAAVVLSAALATLIAIPTLRLRADYLAIATLGFAEIVRIVINNERDYTAGSAGIPGIPGLSEWVPSALRFPLPGATLRVAVPRALVEFAVVAAMVLFVYLFVRRLQLSPWGRVQRTIRADEDLAQALGKNTSRFKLQSFVLGSVIMALAGVASVHLFVNFVEPDSLDPIRTFYVWIGVILGGSGSNRGAVLGGLVVVAIRETPTLLRDQLSDAVFPPRVLTDALAPLVSPSAVPVLDVGALFARLNVGALQLFLVGALVIVIVRYRSEGLLPPKRERIWSAALEDDDA